MKHQRTPGSTWSSRIAATLRSVLSWMHWRRRQREQDQAWLLTQMVEQRERLLWQLPHSLQLNLLPLVEAMVHQQLMLAMQPLAEALKRQDNLLQEQLSLTESHLEILLEDVLNSLQPTAEQMFLVDGLWTRQSSPPNSRT